MAYGSPTVLVDESDVAGMSATAQGGDCCRIYRDGTEKLHGAPPVEAIAAALHTEQPQASGGSIPSRGWRSSLAALPGILFSAFPLGCPACWPAFAGLLGALGLGFLMDTAYLLPLMAGFLLLAVGTLALGARKRRGYGPVIFGLSAAATILVGRFALQSDVVLYGGVATLVSGIGQITGVFEDPTNTFSRTTYWPISDVDVRCTFGSGKGLGQRPSAGPRPGAARTQNKEFARAQR